VGVGVGVGVAVGVDIDVDVDVFAFAGAFTLLAAVKAIFSPARLACTAASLP
jgi:hypothetical protein